MILFASNRGLDVSDEGLYVLLAHPLQENKAGIFNYDLFFKAWYHITGIHFGILGLRILRLVLYLFAAFSLTIFCNKFRKCILDSWSLGLLSFLALLFGYAFLPASLSYNHLTVVLTSFWLLAISSKTTTFFKALILGGLLGGLIYVKITTALILGGVTLLYIIIFKKLSWRMLLGLLLPTFFLEFSLYLYFGENALSRLREASNWIDKRGDYEMFVMLKNTLVGVFWSSLGMVAGWFTKRFVRSYLKQFILLLLITAILGYSTWIAEDWHHVVVLVCAVVIGMVLAKKPDLGANEETYFWIAVLIALPFLLHFGSNVYWLRMGVHYLVFWIIALILLDLDLIIFKNRFLVPYFGLITLFLIFNGLWWHPFGQKPLWTYTEPWEYLPNKNILLRKGQVDILQDFQRQIPNEQHKVPSGYLIGGVPYLLGKTQPTSPGIWNKAQLSHFFPNGIQDGVILYFPTDSLPSNFTSKTIQFGWFE